MKRIIKKKKLVHPRKELQGLEPLTVLHVFSLSAPGPTRHHETWMTSGQETILC